MLRLHDTIILNEDHLPFNGTGKFVGIETDLASDYCLWLTGQGTRWFPWR